MANEHNLGTGRRKTSVARVYIKSGTGNYTINGKDLSVYFPNPEQSYIVKQPLDVTDNGNSLDVMVRVKGGGKNGQAGAIRHGLSRALVSFNDSNYSVLRANGFMTRDPRMVERKKYGQRGARRKFQFSKR